MKICRVSFVVIFWWHYLLQRLFSSSQKIFTQVSVKLVIELFPSLFNFMRLINCIDPQKFIMFELNLLKSHSLIWLYLSMNHYFDICRTLPNWSQLGAIKQCQIKRWINSINLCCRESQLRTDSSWCFRYFHSEVIIDVYWNGNCARHPQFFNNLSIC